MKNSRLISFVLSCAMVFALVVPALATDIETGTTVRGNSLLHALDTKNQEFTILEESTPALSGLPVSYQYTIERTTGEPETVQVTLNLSIQGNNKTYQAVVTGTPKVHTININNSEFEYISGPLRGNINMDGEIYNIIVGFQKHSESEDIQGDVTIQDANYEFEPMFFTFGNVTVDNELLEAIRGLNDQKMEPWMASLKQLSRKARNVVILITTQKAHLLQEHYPHIPMSPLLPSWFITTNIRTV